MAQDTVTYADAHWLWTETVNRLEAMRCLVLEGRDVQAARNFSLFVQWSGLHKFLSPFENNGVLKVDVAFLRWKAKDLQTLAEETLRHNLTLRNNSTLESIHHKLDVIAAHVANPFHGALTEKTASAGNTSEPVLFVIPRRVNRQVANRGKAGRGP